MKFKISNESDFENNVNNLKIVYNKKIDDLEKAMDYYKNYIGNYFRKKIQIINENANLNNVRLNEDQLPIMKITNQHSETLNKLRNYYEAKVKEIESSFFSILRTISAKRMTDLGH